MNTLETTFDLTVYLLGLASLLGLGLVGWLVSLKKHDVSIVDSLWSLMFLLVALVYFLASGSPAGMALAVLVMTALWAVRLAAYITWRNWGEGEDRRYQAIRARNQPGFEYKSLYLVFWLQGAIAWVISLPLLAAIFGATTWGPLAWLGLAVWAVGMFFEAVGDWQLARFKADPANRGKVLDSGLWRYTRHPNYFGNALIWWGFFLIAAAAGGWWTIVSPLLMTLLLLKVSGVSLLEQDIGERRPGYREYVARTNAFIPGPPRPARVADLNGEVKS
jgi:steroid 5-alpha reductase family enzyme